LGQINFTSANCKNCYRCLRSCPVKAIRIKNQQAEIVEERCIGCGHCLAICPQNARQIASDLRVVKKAISMKKKVVVSIAPSFPGHFCDSVPGKVVAAIKKLGFSVVEETAVGAEIVWELYKEFITNSNLDNFITTCCPSANYLVQKYYPELTKYMLPFDSPMVAHGKRLKELYGEDSFVVFIGPCVAKKIEISEDENNRYINAALTFDEVIEWLKEEKIDIDSLEPIKVDNPASVCGGRFPAAGGVLSGLDKLISDKGLEKLCVDGMDECMEIFSEIEKGDIKGVCVEVSACRGSCTGGPDMIKEKTSFYKRQKNVKDYLKDKNKELTYENLELKDKGVYQRNFSDKSFLQEEANEEQLNTIMRAMGKFEPSDELNCGVCGYNTCREKATAVFRGMAETDMCLNYMRNKAERITNVIFESSPSVIFLIDEDMNIVELNPTAESSFATKAEFIKGKPISILIDDSDFIKVKETKVSILGKKVAYPQYSSIFIENVLYLEKQNIILVTMSNISEIESNKKELMRVKENTLNAAQEVIAKQMRVAQEIASLLGETTAETKITLTKLKKIVLGEDGDL
jgi:iron only hydrogenase large subunit-like protein